MSRREHNCSIKILNVLMRNSDRWFSTMELCQMFGVQRKAIYSAVDLLEVNGFGIEVVKGSVMDFPSNQMNYYKFGGIYGTSEV